MFGNGNTYLSIKRTLNIILCLPGSLARNVSVMSTSRALQWSNRLLIKAGSSGMADSFER